MLGFYQLIYGAIIFSTIVLGLSFIGKMKRTGIQSIFIGLYFFSWTIIILSNFLFDPDDSFRNIVGLTMYQSCWFMGPLLYAYDKSSHGVFRFQEKLIAFVPPVLLAIFMISVKTSVAEEDVRDAFYSWAFFFGSIIQVIYIISIIKSLRNQKFKEKGTYTYLWHSLLYYGFLFITILRVVNMLSATYSIEIYDWFYAPLISIMSIYIGLLVYLSLDSSRMINPAALKKHVISVKEDEELSALYKSISDKVQNALIENELIKNADLKLADLSDATEIKAHLISKTLNTLHERSISEFLNDQRIHLATQLLGSKHDVSVKEIMYEVGYNSKSLFYSEFKKRKGKTPLDYRNNS